MGNRWRIGVSDDGGGRVWLRWSAFGPCAGAHIMRTGASHPQFFAFAIGNDGCAASEPSTSGYWEAKTI